MIVIHAWLPYHRFIQLYKLLLGSFSSPVRHNRAWSFFTCQAHVGSSCTFVQIMNFASLLFVCPLYQLGTWNRLFLLKRYSTKGLYRNEICRQRTLSTQTTQAQLYCELVCHYLMCLLLVPTVLSLLCVTQFVIAVASVMTCQLILPC